MLKGVDYSLHELRPFTIFSSESPNKSFYVPGLTGGRSIKVIFSSSNSCWDDSYSCWYLFVEEFCAWGYFGIFGSNTWSLGSKLKGFVSVMLKNWVLSSSGVAWVVLQV